MTARTVTEIVDLYHRFLREEDHHDKDGKLRTIADMHDAAMKRMIDEHIIMLVDAEEPHLIQVREDGFTVQHPLADRALGTLFECPFAQVTFETPPAAPGVYEFVLEDGLFLLRERVS